jgi:hypothetical protein
MNVSRTVLGAATALLLTAALSTTPALADDHGRGRGHGKGKHSRVDRDRHRDRDHDRYESRSRDRYRDHDRYDSRSRDRYRDHDRYAYRDHRPYRSVVRERFVVPHRLRHVDTYDRYYSGRVYFAPHRHVHLVYAFPVYTPYGVEYDPYYYCGDDLYVEHPGYSYDSHYRSRRPRVSIGVHLGF